MKQKHFLVVILSNILLCVSLLTSAQTSFGKAKLINDGWLFNLKDETSAFKPDFNDKNWRRLDLPHDWSIEGELSPTLASCTGYLPGGIGWYRKELNIPVELKGKKVFIYFEGFFVCQFRFGFETDLQESFG